VRGRLPDAVERILDALGRPSSVREVVDTLTGGGVSVDPSALNLSLRSPRFRRMDGGNLALADWGDVGPAPRPRAEAGRPPPTELRLLCPEADEPAGDTRSTDYAPGSWLWVRVDEDALRGTKAPVPSSLMAEVGVAQHRRRTFSSRYGPIVLANDGAIPVRGPVRAVALASGATLGVTLLLGFSPAGDVEVQVRRAGTADSDDSTAVTASARGAQ
jgi:hypothetical protein